MTRLLATTGALFGFGAVILGAFGAHALEGQITPERAEVWTTAADYLGWHGTSLLALPPAVVNPPASRDPPTARHRRLAPDDRHPDL